MTDERVFEIMGRISDEYISEASEVKKARKTGWVKWAAAAALALTLGIGAARYLMPADPAELGTGGGDRGGSTPGGDNEGVMYSVAVLPSGVSKADVTEAVVLSLTETEARSVELLGSRIPSDPPVGLTLAGISEYRTTMKDGTVYQMLRVNYTDGEVMPAATAGGEVSQSYVITFSMSIWSFCPDTEESIHFPAEVTEELFRENEGTVHLNLGDVYVSLHPGGQTAEELAEIAETIMK